MMNVECRTGIDIRFWINFASNCFLQNKSYLCCVNPKNSNMAKNNFILLVSLLLVASYSQQGLNQPRKLSGEENETVLLGFDNYTAKPLYDEHNDSFNTYFL